MPERGDLLKDRARFRAGERQAEQGLDLAGKDDRADTSGEPDRDRIGDELDEGPEPEQPGCSEHEARQDDRQQQAVDAMRRDGRRNEHDEGTGRAADLKTAPAQRGDEKAADDGGVEAPRRRNARRDRDGHGEGQGDDCHGEAGKEVGTQLCG